MSVPLERDPASPFATRSHSGDLWVLASFLLILFAAAPWLRVYHQITSFELELTKIDADGNRASLPVPDDLSFSEYWNRKPEELLTRIESGFRQAAARGTLPGQAPGVLFELTVRYSWGSPDRDRTATWLAP